MVGIGSNCRGTSSGGVAGIQGWLGPRDAGVAPSGN